MFYHCSTNKSWEDIMSTTGATENRHLIPALGRLYPKVSECAYVLLRVAAGLMLIPHVWPKLMAGPAAVASNVMVRRGVEPALLAAYLVIIVEVLGVVCITLGLFTRVVAALLVIEFLVIVKVHSASGWMTSVQGAEFPFLWLIVFIFILVRGGGPCSSDRKLGWEI
jgi:putative oxidoreductase